MVSTRWNHVSQKIQIKEIETMKLMTFEEVKACFRPDDDVASIEVCLAILFDGQTALVDENLDRIDVDFHELARRVYNSFDRAA